MKTDDLQNIIKIKNEIKTLLIEIEKKENNLLELIKDNNFNIIIYKKFLENIIEEYHNICMQIYK